MISLRKPEGSLPSVEVAPFSIMTGLSERRTMRAGIFADRIDDKLVLEALPLRYVVWSNNSNPNLVVTDCILLVLLVTVTPYYYSRV